MFDDFGDGIDAEDWSIIGPLSQDLAEERKEQERLLRELEDEGRAWNDGNSK